MSNVINVNVDKNEESNSDMYDSDLDPEYKQPTVATNGKLHIKKLYVIIF